MSQKISITRGRNKNTAGKAKAGRTDKEKVNGIDKEKVRTAASKTAADIIYLAGCMCNGLLPLAKRVSAMDLEELHALSSSLSLNSLTYTALERTPGFELSDTPLMGEWKEERDREIYKSLMFDREWEKVKTFLENSGIWYLLLKGLIIKKCYPEPGMRQMADVDILYDINFDEQVREWFLNRGYSVKTYRTGSHDAYLKPPFYNFELHRELFGYPQDEAWCRYYADVRGRVILNEGPQYGYHFTDDDFYIYFMVHSCKHYRAAGTGLRTLLDNYVYLKAKRKDLHPDYIKAELKKLGIAGYERRLRKLSRKLFSDPENFTMDLLTGEDLNFLDKFLDFGTYGTIQNKVTNTLNRLSSHGKTPSVCTKMRYLLERLFPDPQVFKEYYPFFYRHRTLMPLGYVYRLVYKGITNGKQAITEIKALF